MAGTNRIVGSPTGLTVTTTFELDKLGSPTTWRRAQFYVDTTAITRTTGTIDITLRARVGSGVVDVASITGISATGLSVALTLDAAFLATEDIVPDATEAVITFVGDTSLYSADIICLGA